MKEKKERKKGRKERKKDMIYVGFDQNSFFRERPFFANKKNISRIFRELHVFSRKAC
jgi:hypothetical protein